MSPERFAHGTTDTLNQPTELGTALEHDWHADRSDGGGLAGRFRGWWRRYDSMIYPVVTLAAVLVLWEVLVDALDIQPYLLPKPSAVLATLVSNFPDLAQNAVPTLVEITVGYILSIIIGIPIAMAIVSSRTFEKCVYPILIASQTVPKIALAPLFVMWFGFGIESKILITFLIAFFVIVVDTAVGLRSVPLEMIHLGRSMGASKSSLFLKVRLPWALPNIFGALKVAVTLAVIGAVVGEFIGSDQGLGYVLLRATGRLDTSLLFAAILVLVVIGLVTFLGVDLLERISIPWHVSARREPTVTTPSTGP